MENQNGKTTSFLNKSLIKNISILTSLLFLGIVLMYIVNHYEKADLVPGEPTSAAQLFGQ
ncbi:MAG: hypothetical protein KBC22_01540 [Candidatus Pacebacteria bacterium]|nr:hypothetical protein [Candidatus Paceibacterota bacterium]